MGVLLFDQVKGRAEVLVDESVPFVRNLDHVMTNGSLLIESSKLTDPNIGDSNYVFDIEALEFFDILGSSQVANVQGPLLPLTRLQYTVYFFVCNHTLRS